MQCLGYANVHVIAGFVELPPVERLDKVRYRTLSFSPFHVIDFTFSLQKEGKAFPLIL